MNKIILDNASRVLPDSQLGKLYERDKAGQSIHGKMTSDRLHSTDWNGEATEELIDAVWYLTADAVSRPKAKKRNHIDAARLLIADALELLAGAK